MKNTVKMLLINSLIIAISIFIVAGLSKLNQNTKPDQETVQQDLITAPLFSAIDSNGVTHSLEQYKGKIVVLEWKNHLCPFVKKYYKNGHMQALQKDLTQQDIVWLSVISSAQGKQGYVTPEQCNIIINEENSSATAVLLDSKGEIGRLYGAKTTPHMFVINEEGKLIYNGSIDSIASADSNDIDVAVNYVVQTIEENRLNKIVTTKRTNPYGCSVKY